MSVLIDLMRYRAQKNTIILPHWNRILQDGGVFYDTSRTYMQKLADDNQKYGSSLKLCINPYLTGNKIRTSGVNNFATKSYDISGVKNDATQTTATNQPYLSKIAPIEKPSLLNPNGDDTYMTHPTISFGASDPWSVEVVLNGNSSQNSAIKYCGGTGIIGLYQKSGTAYRYTDNDGNSTIFTSNPFEDYSKSIYICWVHNGTSLSLYKDGKLQSSNICSAKISYSQIIPLVSDRHFYGKFYHYSIFSKALSASEVANRAALLRSIYPEIESVPIGTQTWAVRNFDAVCTPQGNLMSEVQAATNTEKITDAADREFSSDTGFWAKDAGVTISDGVCHFNHSALISIGKGGLVTAGKWYKVSFSVKNYISGSIRSQIGNASSYRSANGAYVDYLYATTVTPYFASGGAVVLDLDDVSIQEVGWSDSQNLYDYVYARTTGTVEQKTYAAVKAAAMWRSPNNDVALAANYSKLYNDFATKLFDMDINYYNVANPTTPWGWGVPTESDWTTLQTYINNDANALEHLGTTYWTSGQGTNTTGFTALPAGYVKEDGTYAGSGTTAIFASSDDMSIPRLGKSIRLIKA